MVPISGLYRTRVLKTEPTICRVGGKVVEVIVLRALAKGLGNDAPRTDCSDQIAAAQHAASCCLSHCWANTNPSGWNPNWNRFTATDKFQGAIDGWRRLLVGWVRRPNGYENQAGQQARSQAGDHSPALSVCWQGHDSLRWGLTRLRRLFERQRSDVRGLSEFARGLVLRVASGGFGRCSHRRGDDKRRSGLRLAVSRRVSFVKCVCLGDPFVSIELFVKRDVVKSQCKLSWLGIA